MSCNCFVYSGRFIQRALFIRSLSSQWLAVKKRRPTKILYNFHNARNLLQHFPNSMSWRQLRPPLNASLFYLTRQNVNNFRLRRWIDSICSLHSCHHRAPFSTSKCAIEFGVLPFPPLSLPRLWPHGWAEKKVTTNKCARCAQLVKSFSQKFIRNVCFLFAQSVS